jgi:hypothetical protein
MKETAGMNRRVALGQPTAHTTGESLVEGIGGAATIARLVDDLYARLWSDEGLAPWLADASPAALRPAQIAFFVEALGGGASPDPAREPHITLGDAPLLRVALHVYDAVMALALPDGAADEAILAIFIHALRP